MKTTAKVELKDPLQNHFIHLFDLEFQGTPGMDPVVPEEEQDGDHIGSGEGVVKGDAISGKIKFSMFAENCALLLVRAGVEPAPGQHICKANPGGVIKTDDGALIEFNARGYGFRGPDPANPHLWTLTLGVQYGSDDPRYQWLNTSLGVWYGVFDEQTGKTRYRAYGPSDGSL